MQETVSDEPNSTGNYTREVTGLFTSTTTTLTRTSTTFLPELYNSDYDEGTIHYVVVVSSLVIFVGFLCSVKSIVKFIRSLSRRQQDANVSGSVRPGSSFFRWFSDEPPPYPGKYSRTNVNYLPSYESAVGIVNQSGQTTDRDVGDDVVNIEPSQSLPDVNGDNNVIMFTVPEDNDTGSNPTQRPEPEPTNENRLEDPSESHAVNLVDETCSENTINDNVENGSNVFEVTSSGSHVTMLGETSGECSVREAQET